MLNFSLKESVNNRIFQYIFQTLQSEMEFNIQQIPGIFYLSFLILVIISHYYILNKNFRFKEPTCNLHRYKFTRELFLLICLNFSTALCIKIMYLNYLLQRHRGVGLFRREQINMNLILEQHDQILFLDAITDVYERGIYELIRVNL